MNNNNIRWEINDECKLIQSEPKLTNKLDTLIEDAFSQNGWTYNCIENSGCYRKIKIYNSAINEEKVINLYVGRVRKEEDNRSPYEKRIQLGNTDPRIHGNELTIILGFYVFNENADLKDSLIISWPVEQNKNYPANPSLRVNVENEMLKAKVNGFYIDRTTGKNVVAFRPEFMYFYLNNIENIFRNDFINKISNNEIKNYDESRVKGGYNMIYYGTPGCGKSFLVNQKYNELEYEVIRTTFYPDYSNSDFIGQIIPKVDEEHNVYYDFQEGPFSISLLTALKNPEKKVCLVIEEINRGNASAIFGDIFQLLDRDKNGNSIYKINNYNIAKYLLDNDVKNIDKVYIPSNLWVIGTMNTCDQNVYTLDTAFKRRWKMNKISNKFDNENKLANMYIPGSNYTWEEFVEKINQAILEKNPGGLNGEDKQLGVYFVTDKELVFNKTDDYNKASEYFAEKVLMYIWEDIAKIDPTLWFSSNFKSFDELLDAFNKKRLDVFKDLFTENSKSKEEILNEE